MHIQLTMTSEQQRGYYKMIGHTTQLDSTSLTPPSPHLWSLVLLPSSFLGVPPETPSLRPLLYIPPVLFAKNPGLSFCCPHRCPSITRSRST
jgi:hypothetical protein